MTEKAGPGKAPFKVTPELTRLVVIAVAAGVVFMMAPGLFGLKSSSKNPPAGAVPVAAQPKGDKETDIELQQERMSRQAEAALADIAGVGRVRVKVTLATGVISVPVVNVNEQETTTGEKAADKSSRDQKTTTLARNHVVIDNTLAVTKQLRPEIAGVLVTAEGASSPRVREDLTKAVAEHLNIPLHLVRVEPAEKGRS